MLFDMVHRLFMDLENEPLVFTQSGRRKRIVDIYPREQGTAEAAHHADLDAAAQMEIFGRLFSWHRNTPTADGDSIHRLKLNPEQSGFRPNHLGARDLWIVFHLEDFIAPSGRLSIRKNARVAVKVMLDHLSSLDFNRLGHRHLLTLDVL